jgi:hypothetical protein
MNYLGRPGSRRPATVDVPMIDVFELHRTGNLGRGPTVTLTIGGVGKVMVSLAWELTTGHCVGARPWFTCPICSARRRFLHLQGNRLGCRECFRLAYRSRTVRWASSRPLRRAMRLRARLGAAGLFTPFPACPRWNWAGKQYDRITREIELCERELIGAVTPIYTALMRKV